MNQKKSNESHSFYTILSHSVLPPVKCNVTIPGVHSLAPDAWLTAPHPMPPLSYRGYRQGTHLTAVTHFPRGLNSPEGAEGRVSGPSQHNGPHPPSHKMIDSTEEKLVFLETKE